MSADGNHQRFQPRWLLWPLVGLFLLSVALQAASLIAMMEIEASLERAREQLAVAERQRELVSHFENATYLAIVGLAASDWELLLRQRAIAQSLAERFTAVNTTLLEGGTARIGEQEVVLAAIQDPESRAALGSVADLWSKTYAAHVRVLRSENRSLKENPDLEQLRAMSRQLDEALVRASALIQRHARAETNRLSRIQRIIPVGAFVLTLSLFAFVVGRLLVPFAVSTQELARSEQELRRARDELEQRVAERTAELAHANEALRQAHDGLELRVKERTQELKEAQRHAVELARQAGMAELATNVLHNVGNVLNSVNTSAVLLGERLRALRVASLVKVAGLLEEQRPSLATFLTADERGQRVPEFLGSLGQHLSTERDELLEMTAALGRHIEHIRVIIELQQTYATSSSLIESASLEELAEDALRISTAALARHGITIERQYTPLPRVMLDKHKLLQILLNLISNAKYALGDTPPGQRRLTLRIERATQDRIRLRIEDTGMGIAPELLTKIFQHGFTTRKEGHGFGLHSCALVAQALGGSLTAHSDGPGKGAIFTLELPYRPANLEQAKTGS